MSAHNHQNLWEDIYSSFIHDSQKPNGYFQIVVLEKTVESPLDSKEIKPVNPKGN